MTWNVSRGLVSFLMRASREIDKGAVREVRGTWQVDLGHLDRTRGTLSMDVASLAMTSFEDEERNRTQTADFLRQLRVEGADSRTATFTIKSVASAEPGDLSGDAGSPRKARLKMTGDFTFQGHTTPYEVEIELTIAFEGSTPTYMFVQSIRDVVAPLPESEVSVALQFAADPAPR